MAARPIRAGRAVVPEQGRAGNGLLEQKIVTARCYCDQLLPPGRRPAHRSHGRTRDLMAASF
jgi:hypothetical protein